MNFSDAHRINDIMRTWVKDMRKIAEQFQTENSAAAAAFESTANDDEKLRRRFLVENGLEDEE